MKNNYFKVLICLLGIQMLFGFTASLGQSIVSLTLINADTEQAIKTLANGEVLNLATLPTKNLNIRANTNPTLVGSVVFSLNGVKKTESAAPYAYAGDSNGNYNAWTPATGSYTMITTPYSASGGTGTAGTALTISFTVTNTTSTTPAPPANQAPVANAGPDKSITLPTSSVVLNGSATDADGSISSYAWSQVSGPNQANFGGTTTACQAAYEEKNGLVVAEMENLPIPSGWRKYTAASGYTGSSYVEWINAAQLSNPGVGIIETTIKITKTGKYYFHWRNKVGSGTSFTEHNDSWLKFPNASNFYAEGGRIVYPHGSGKTPNPNGAGSNGWFKVFSSGTTSWSWSTNTSDHENLQIVAEFNTPGIYKIQIAARSNYHLIDRFVLRHATVSAATAQTLTNTETRCTSTSTSSGTTVASPTVSGLVQGSYVFRLTVTDDKGAKASDDVTVKVNAAASRIGYGEEEQGAESAQINAYPNPSREQITLDVHLPSEAPLEISIFDMSGKQWASEKSVPVKLYSKDISLSHLKPGVYLLKVKYGSETVTRKIIKY